MAAELKPVFSLPKGPLSSSLLDTDSKINIMYSFCPTGRLLAFISETEAQFIATEAHPNMLTASTTLYDNSFIGKLNVINDPILPCPLATGVCVLPIALIRSGAPHLSSVVMVGFDDGSIAAYSKTGRLIFMQQLAVDAQVIKIRTMSNKKENTCSNVVVLFNGGIVCIIDGASLAELIEEKVSNKDDADCQIHLVYKKYNLEQQASRLDVALIGHSLPSYFDHLREACVVDGYDSVIRQGPLNEAKLVIVGEQPMISLYRLNKDAGSINVSEVVHEVASRMTNAVLDKLSFASGWLGWGGGASRKATPTSPQPQEEKQRSLNLRMSTNIPDMRRVVHSVTVSPLTDVAVLLDDFGRILLLDLNNLIIRRMWKGYRGAQCGWLLVSDPVKEDRHTQCLCVYLPRRGIIEFWPVQSGLRAGVLSIGKNCTVLYTDRAIFGRNDVIKGLNIPSSSFGNTLMILNQDGNVITFTVPFSSLVKRNNPLSHDFHLLQNLQKSIIKGESGIFESICAAVKSSQSLLEVVQLLIRNYSKDARHSFLATIDVCVKRCTSSKNCSVPEELLTHFKMIKSLSLMYFEIEDVIKVASSEGVPVINSLYECLSEFIGMRSKVRAISELVSSYYQLYQSSMNATPTFTLADFLSCFQIIDCSISCLLPELTNQVSAGTATMEATLDIDLRSDLTDTMLMNLGAFIYQVPLLRCNVNGLIHTLSACPVSHHSLIVLLIKYYTSNSLPEAEPSLIITSLHSLLSALLRIIHQKEKLNSELLTILSCTSYVGHALLIALLFQRLDQGSGEKEKGKEEEDEEEWETVRVEEEVWSILIDQLIILTTLTLVTGTVTQPLPSITYTTDEFDGNINELELNTLFKGDHVVCVSTLEGCGPILLTNCISKSVVDKRETGGVVQERWNNLDNNKELVELLKMYPDTLSLDNILIYCALHSASEWNKDSGDMMSLSMSYIEHIQSPTLTKGICSYLWHMYLEKSLFQLVEESRKNVVLRSDYNSKLLWVSRNVLHCLEQLMYCREEKKETPIDTTLVHCPSGILFLHSFIKLFPTLDTSLASTGIQLLMQTEIFLSAGYSVSVFTYYAPVVRSWFKKGLFLSSYKSGDNVGKVVMNKRAKLLNDAVAIVIKEREPSITSLASVASLRDQPVTQCCCYVKDYTEIVLSLASLWGVSDVEYNWIANLVSAGLTDKALQIFQSLSGDRTNIANQLLLVIGQLCQCLMDNIEKSRQSIILAQSPPSLLEWMRKQRNHFSFLVSPPKCDGKALMILTESLRAHIVDVKNEKIINELSVFIKSIY